jgi:hypothetical protein
MAEKKILVIVVVIIALLMMAAPVSAVKPPVDSQGNIWTALEALQNQIAAIKNQITALTQRVDTLENSPIPEYRAGTYTTPSEESVRYHIVTFSHPMPNTNYRVSITNADPSTFTRGCPPDSILTIESKTLTGFNFSYRQNSVDPYPGSICIINFNHKFDYIAIADN